jgi:cytochrome c
VTVACAVRSGSGMGRKARPIPSVGRDATPKEVAAWDIDVRPDFKGLPAGSGSVAKGQDMWESQVCPMPRRVWRVQ